MKILFCMSHAGYARNFERTLGSLLANGHEVVCALERRKTGASDETAILDRLAAAYPRLSYEGTPRRADADLEHATRALRFLADYLRYLEPRYREATKLRARAAERVPAGVRAALGRPLLRSRAGTWALLRLARAVERAAPPDPAVVDYLQTVSPDLVVVTPLVELGSVQADYVRAAQRLGIPCALCVFSWDNLTNKGLIRDVPDLVAVWNEPQRDEAIRLHGVPPDRVVVTGSVAYDHWFDWRASRDRVAFCEEVGIRSDRPIILYLGSSPWIGEGEDAFVRRWLAAIREGHGRVATASVVVRPHPLAGAEWTELDLRDLGPAAVWPRVPVNPTNDSTRNDFYDSLAYADAVVGLNTSAQIESAILGKPVLAVTPPEYAETQGGTLHFHHLTGGDRPLLTIAASLDDHVEQLEAALDDDGSRSRAFVERFVRPFGREVAATPLLVEALERLASIGGRPATSPGVVASGLFNRWRRLVLSRFPPPKRKARIADRPAGAEPKPDRKHKKKPTLDPVDEAVAAVAAVVEAEGDIAVGPWTSEVGYELLYWIPFLHFVSERWPGVSDRMVTLSRGGVSSWYGDLGRRYVDIFDLVTADEFVAAKNAERVNAGGKQKQLAATDLDRTLVRMSAEALGIDEPRILHPGIVYRLYKHLWRADRVPRFLEVASFHRIEAPAVPEALETRLPDDFASVRFYFSESLPPTAGAKAELASLTTGLAATAPVVSLDPGLRFDDHLDYVAEAEVVPISDLLTARDNLATQTAVIARSHAFVGTYGGLSYLAPLLGVTSLAFYASRDGFHRGHLELAQRVFAATNFGDLVALPLDRVSVIGAVLSPAAAERRG